MEKRKSNTVELPMSPISSEGFDEVNTGGKLNGEPMDGRNEVLPIPDYEISSTQPRPPLNGQQAGMSPVVYNQTGIHAGGYNQTGMPAGGYNQTWMPAGGYNQTGMPAGGFNQSGMPAGGYNQTGMPAGGYDQTGMPAGGYYPQPPFYPQGYFPPPALNNNNMQTQQQQTTNVSVVVGPPPPAISFRGPITLACVTFWCFNPLFGLIAFILAMIGKSEAAGGNLKTAKRLSHASVGVSLSGKIIGLLAAGLALGLVFGVYRSYDYLYVPSSHCSSICSYGHYTSDCNVCCSSYYCDSAYYTYSYTDTNGCRHCT